MWLTQCQDQYVLAPFGSIAILLSIMTAQLVAIKWVVLEEILDLKHFTSIFKLSRLLLPYIILLGFEYDILSLERQMRVMMRAINFEVAVQCCTMCGIMDCKFMFHKIIEDINTFEEKWKEDDINKVISFVWHLGIVSAQLLKWTINLFCDFVYGNFGLYLFFFFLSFFLYSWCLIFLFLSILLIYC